MKKFSALTRPQQIQKMQQVHHDTYHAFHIDFTRDGVKGEIQIHTPASLNESVANHDIRNVYGEKPPAPLEQVKKQNQARAYKLAPDQAQQEAQALEIIKQARDKGGENV